jgi:hypothetical protein
MKKIIIILMLGIFLNCDKRELPTQSGENISTTIEQYFGPKVINPNTKVKVSVYVTAPQDIKTVGEVELTIAKVGSNEIVANHYLYDDGAAKNPDDGDVIAYDGVFTQVFMWSPTDMVDNKYNFEFKTSSTDGQEEATLQVEIISLTNRPPEIRNVSMPEILESGFSGVQYFRVTVFDTLGVEDITKVTFKGRKDGAIQFDGELTDEGTDGDQVAEDGIYTFQFDRSFAAGKKGQYELEFVASDRSGATSEPFLQNMMIENDPPYIVETSAPDSVTRPPLGEYIYFPVTAKVDDPQTMEDVKNVQLKFQKPDGTYPSQGPYFKMFDNGLGFDINYWDQGFRGDEVEGDSVYTTIIIFGANTEENEPELGDYTLTFEVEDWVSQKTDTTKHIITLK